MGQMNLFVVQLTSGFLITAILFGGGLLVLLPSLSSGDIVIFLNIKILNGLIVSYLQGKSWTSLIPGAGEEVVVETTAGSGKRKG